MIECLSKIASNLREDADEVDLCLSARGMSNATTACDTRCAGSTADKFQGLPCTLAVGLKLNVLSISTLSTAKGYFG